LIVRSGSDARVTECEITEPVDTTDATGEGNRDAIGWSRRPLHRVGTLGAWGRRKRWHHWCVTTPRDVFSVTFADLDYLGIASVFVLDRSTGETIEDRAVRPFGWRVVLPDDPLRGLVELRAGAMHLRIDDRGDRVALNVRSRRVSAELEVTRTANLDTLNLLVPFDRGRFQFNAKQVAMPARGTVAFAGQTRRLGAEAFACLDYGRGAWPHHTRWNWASGAGTQNGATVGLNLGARWTDGTGVTENGVWVDGRLQKIHGDVRFEWSAPEPRRPWTITGSDVDLRFTVEHVRAVRDIGLPVGAGLCLGFGSFAGRAGGVEIRDLFGWAEDFHARW